MRRGLLRAAIIAVTLIALPAYGEPRAHDRAAGLAWLGVGTLVFAGGMLAHRASGDWTLPSTLLAGTGALSVGGGVALLWRAQAQTSVAIRLSPPGLDPVAGRDPKRGSDLGVRVPVWRTSF